MSLEESYLKLCTKVMREKQDCMYKYSFCLFVSLSTPVMSRLFLRACCVALHCTARDVHMITEQCKFLDPDVWHQKVKGQEKVPNAKWSPADEGDGDEACGPADCASCAAKCMGGARVALPVCLHVPAGAAPAQATCSSPGLPGAKVSHFRHPPPPPLSLHLIWKRSTSQTQACRPCRREMHSPSQ